MDNINNKVQVKSQNTMKNISVHYTTDFIAQSLAKDWAVKMDSLVDNTDYSSKYYATKSKLNKTETDNMLAEAREQASIAKLCVKKAYTAINQKLAPATDEFLGGIKVGESLYISEDGVLNTDAEHLDLYEKNDINAMLSEKLDSSDLPTNLSSFNNDIPFATLSSLNNLNTQVVKKTDIATADSLGIVKPDNNTIKVNADGELSSPVTIDKITQFNAAKTGYVSEDKDILNWIQEMAHSTFDRSKFQIVGSPDITDDGVASGFSGSNYLTKTIDISGTIIKIREKFHVDTFTNSTLSDLYRSDYFVFLIGGQGYIPRARIGTDAENNWISGVDYTMQENKDYIIECVINTTTKFATLNLYDVNGNLLGTKTNSLAFNSITLGSTTAILGAYPSQNRGFTNGSIDLKQFSITVDGVEVFSGNKTGIDTIKPDDYTVGGTPTISADGVASGFSTSNYLQNSNLNISTNNFAIECQFTLPSVVSGGQYLFYFSTSSITRLVVNNSKIFFYDNTNAELVGYTYTGNFDINDLIYVKGTFTANGITLEITDKTKNVTITPVTSTKVQMIQATQITFGKGTGTVQTDVFTGSIDLNAFKIYVDGNLVYQPCLKIPYMESFTGSKIVQSIYRDRVTDMYEQFGYAPYYTLSDTDFSLPQGELYGLIEKRARDIAHPIGEPFYRLTDEIFEDEVRLEGAEVDKGLYLAIEQKLASYCSAGSDSTKIVLPNFINHVPWGANTQGYIEAGLPNITGYVNGVRSFDLDLPSGGAFQSVLRNYNVQNFWEGNRNSNNGDVSFDASRSNSIYGASSTVQPPAFKVRWLARYK